MPSGEISTAGIVHDAFKNGKRVFVPYTYKVSKPEADGPTSIMDMVNLEDISDYESLESDKWGIPTPAESSIAERVNSFGTVGKSEGASKFSESEKSGLDLVVMPGMAFDVTLNRLGHGKGFYDFFLMRLKQQAEAKDARMPFLGRYASVNCNLDALIRNF